MRRVIIAGNWKMNKTVTEAAAFAKEVLPALSDEDSVEVVLCPPYPALAQVNEVISGSKVKLGAQDVHWEDSGAYTGEVSPGMLKDAGCEFVIIGHSERRALFGETNEGVNKKVKAALRAGLTPIMCVGEKLEEREAGKTFDVVRDHVENGLRGLTKEDVARVVIAYEPVWAIGTGRTATPEQAEEVQSFIRKLLQELYDEQTASAITIQYGGSVKPENIVELIKQDDVDGALVGGASLKADSFIKIVKGAKVKVR